MATEHNTLDLKLVPQESRDLLFGYMRETEQELSIKIPEKITLISISFYIDTKPEKKRSRGPSFALKDLFGNVDDSDDSEDVPSVQSAPEEQDYYQITAYYGIEDDDGWDSRRSSMFGDYGRVNSHNNDDEEEEIQEYPFAADFEKLKLVSQSSKDLISGYIRESEKEILLIIPELVILISILFYYEIEKGQEIEEKVKRKHSRALSFGAVKDLFNNEAVRDNTNEIVGGTKGHDIDDQASNEYNGSENENDDKEA